MVDDGGRSRPDLATLTGVRSGKRSYYRAYVRSDERMAAAVRAMDSISRALVRTVEGPRGLLEEVARAAAAHLEARWTVLALADGHLRGARPRFLAVRRHRPLPRRRGAAAGVRPSRAGGRARRPRRPLDRDPRLGPRADDAGGAPRRQPGAAARPARRPRARRPLGAAHPGQPGGRLAAHLRAVPGGDGPAPPRAAAVRRGHGAVARPRRAHRRAPPGGGAAAAGPPARADRRRAAPDRPRAARQRQPVRPVGRHGRRGGARRRRRPRRGRRARGRRSCSPPSG